jgi:hypothetical protein
MPAPDGKLTGAEIEKIKSWVDQHRKSPCPVCQNNLWTVGAVLTTPVNLVGPGPEFGVGLGGKIFPQAQVICVTCGHTQFFNAIVMGLTTSIQESEPPLPKGK